jgi:hypothetical protein
MVKLSRTYMSIAALGSILAVIFLLVFIVYSHKLKDHLIYETQDPETQAKIRVFCRWDGGSTYYSYVSVTVSAYDLEIYRTIVGCGVDMLSDCKNSQSDCGVKALSINLKENSLLVEYRRKPAELFPLPERLKGFLDKSLK